MTGRRILLGQLANWGDCLLATTVARQIKEDEPTAHLTWAIGSICRPLLWGNPHVDAVWEVPLASTSAADVIAAWRHFTDEARARAGSQTPSI